MPTFDLLAFAKSTARVLLIAGVIALTTGLLFMLLNALKFTLELFATTHTLLSKELTSSTGGTSCFFYFMDQLGLTAIFNSFFWTVTGLIMFWVGYYFNIVFSFIAIIAIKGKYKVIGR